MEDLSTSVLWIVAISLILNFLFIVLAIRVATRHKRQIWNQRQQINLLIEIAEKLGSTKSEMLETIRQRNNSDYDEYL